jgi:hypothetical protein
MVDCKPFTTAVDIQAKLAADYGPLVQDASQFRSIACALQDLTFTRLGIAYVVQQIFLHMHDPQEPHLTAKKRILRYLQGCHSTTFYCVAHPAPTSPSTQTLIVRVVRTHVALHQAMRCFWGQPGVLVGQMTDCRLSFQRGG